MKLSIITVNLNNVKGLQKTIDSILSQTWQEFEYVIIDGGSIDGSKEIIEELSMRDKRLKYWESIPDSGIYEAMNKGIKKVTGKYIHFLNSGDYLSDENVYQKVMNTSSMIADVICGNRIDVYEEGKHLLNKNLKQKSKHTFDDVYCGRIPHSSTFTQKSLFDRFGLFNESYFIVSDTEFYLKTLGLGKCSSEFIDVTISCFDMNGISKNSKTKALRQSEFEVMKRNVLSDELVEAYEFTEKYRYKIHRINKSKWSALLLRVLNRLAYLING